MELLIGMGVHPSAAYNEGLFPLLKASDSGNLAVAQCLVYAGADLNTWHSNGRRPLMVVALARRLDMVSGLADRGAKTGFKEKDTNPR